MSCTEYNCDELLSCQREIRRLRSVVRELQEEVSRYKTIAYNAMVEGQIEERMSHFDVLRELDMSEEEYQAIVSED